MTTDDRRLAVVFCQAQWQLEDAAHDVPAGRFTTDQYDELATTLETLANLVRNHAKCTAIDSDHDRNLEPEETYVRE